MDPYYECPDDTICCACHKKLPEPEDSDEWQYNGFCNPMCYLEYYVKQYAGAPLYRGPVNRGMRKEMLDALQEVKEVYEKATEKGD